MITDDQLDVVQTCWTTVLGTAARRGPALSGRQLWPVTADDGRAYFLKRLGPWRNLPVADEARILRWLANHGIDVADFMITDSASIFAGAPEDSFVLIPRLDSDDLEPSEVIAAERSVGQTIAELHGVLSCYPWSANSYVERLGTALTGELVLPSDVEAAYAPLRDRLVDAVDRLPTQLVHGDLTPDNVLLRRPGEVSGFIDFDHLPIAPRVWDVCRYLSRRMRARWQCEQTRIDRLGCVKPFLDGYRNVVALTAAELAVMPELIMAANIIEVSYSQKVASGLLDRRMLPDHLEVLADTTETVRWQLAHLDELRHAVVS
jgi:Ser/Thr protein kinase RdoA (MazF antagonist)